jgi:hypothetical protein
MTIGLEHFSVFLSEKRVEKNFVELFLPLSLHSFNGSLFRKRGKREFSSAGSEHLPYKQRVGGSNPSTPTIENQALTA